MVSSPKNENDVINAFIEHILGEHELNVLYCLMNVTVNLFVLVSVNAHCLSLTSFNRVTDFYRAFQMKTRLKHTVNMP